MNRKHISGFCATLHRRALSAFFQGWGAVQKVYMYQVLYTQSGGPRMSWGENQMGVNAADLDSTEVNLSLFLFQKIACHPLMCNITHKSS